jgi:hypothetical protein
VQDKNNPKRDNQINDTWIAACALASGLPLVSDNYKDFVWMQKALGLNLVYFSNDNEKQSAKKNVPKK